METEKLIEKLSQEQNESSRVVRIALVYAEFASLVRRMREAQVKRFEFYTDDGWWEDRAIELEKEVDEYLEKMEQAGSSREG